MLVINNKNLIFYFLIFFGKKWQMVEMQHKKKASNIRWENCSLFFINY